MIKYNTKTIFCILTIYLLEFHFIQNLCAMITFFYLFYCNFKKHPYGTLFGLFLRIWISSLMNIFSFVIENFFSEYKAFNFSLLLMWEFVFNATIFISTLILFYQLFEAKKLNLRIIVFKMHWMLTGTPNFNVLHASASTLQNVTINDVDNSTSANIGLNIDTQDLNPAEFITMIIMMTLVVLFLGLIYYKLNRTHPQPTIITSSDYDLQTDDKTEKEFRRSQKNKHFSSRKQSKKKHNKKEKLAKRVQYKLQSDDVNFVQYDWTIKLVEDILTLLRMISSAKYNSDYGFAAINFIKLRTNKPIIRCEYATKLIDHCQNLFDAEEEYEMQSFDFDDYLHTTENYLNKYEEMRESKFFKKIYKCIMYSLSFSVFKKLGISFDTFNYNLMEKEMIKRKFSNRGDAIHTILDTLVFLLKQGRTIMVTGNVDNIFHSGKSYVEWYDKVQKLQRQSRMLSHPEFSGTSVADFLANLDDAIEKGECMLKYSNILNDYEKKNLKHSVNDLHMLKFDHVSKRKAKESRDIPFSVMVFSPPKMGKSSIMHNLRVHYAKVRGLRPEKDAVFTRNPLADHWDGYDNSYWGCIFDDIAFLNPNCSNGPDPSVSEFLQAINGESYITKQAELMDKGNIAFKSEFCVATTNTLNLNAHYYFSCPSAVQRRFPYVIVPKVRPEYTGDDGCLDALKVPRPDHYYDYWTWSVKKVKSQCTEANLKRYADFEDILVDANLKEFLIWYTKAIKDHRKVQDIIRESGQSLCDIRLCEICCLPETMCDCVQSIDICCLSTQYLSKFILGYIAILCYIIYKYMPFFRSIYSATNRIQRVRSFYRWLDDRTQHIISTYCQRRFWLDLGDKIGSSIPGYKLAVGLIAGLSIGVILNYFRNNQYFVQGNDVSGNRPTPDKEEKENVWYKDDYQLSTFDLTPSITSYKGLSNDKVISLLERNLVTLIFDRGVGVTRQSRALCVSGQIYLVNNHCVPDLPSQRMTIIQQSRECGVTTNITITLSDKQLTRFPERDLCFIEIRNLPPKKNIVELFAKKSLNARVNGVYIHRNRDGKLIKNKIIQIHKVPNFDVRPLKVKCDVWKGIANEPTVVGDCGSIMLGFTSLGPAILGIHVLGCNTDIVALQTDYDFIKDFVDQCSFNLQSGEPQLSSLSKHRVLGDLHKKSTIRYVQKGTSAVYGSFNDFRGKPKSTVCVTPLAHELSPLGYKIKYTKPEMESWEPWRIALLGMTNPVNSVDQGILDKCVDGFANDILSKLPKHRLEQLEVYDDFTAINGAAGVSYVDKINRSTSAGNPWKCSKKYFMEAVEPEGGLSDPVKVNDEIMDRVRHIESEYSAGRVTHPNFCAHLKDEPVSFKKAKMKKTRVFTGAPFDWSIVVRKYLLSFIRVLQNERLIFEAAPGTVAQSLEWTELYEHVTKFGLDNMVAGDYKAFDKEMPPQFVLAAFKIILLICMASGNYTEEQIRIVQGISLDTAFPLVDFNGDLIQFFGSNPSGHPLTVIINSLVNSLYQRYCYYNLNPEKEVESFQDNVALMTYGDDNMMGVSSNTPWFNHTSIQSELAKIGVVYTMADKEAESIPYIHINEVSFLKRTWRFDEDVGALLCPLEHESIEKMLMVWTRSKTITEEEQICAVVSSAVREYFFYGKDTFEYKRGVLKNILLARGYGQWIQESTFPTWDELYDQFWNASKHLQNKSY